MLRQRLSRQQDQHSSRSSRHRLRSFVFPALDALALFCLLPRGSGQTIEFFSDATCTSSIKTIDSVTSLSCNDISDMSSFVAFTWPTDIGQILFYNADAGADACADGSANDALASLNVGWVTGCHVVDSTQGGVFFPQFMYNKLDDTAATVAYAKTTEKEKESDPESTSSSDNENVTVTKHITKTTYVTPDADPSSAEETKTTSKHQKTSTSSAKPTPTSKSSSKSSTSKSSLTKSRSSSERTVRSQQRLLTEDFTSSAELAMSGSGSISESLSDEFSSSFSEESESEDTDSGASATSQDGDRGDGNNSQDSLDDSGGGGSNSTQTVIIVASSCGVVALLGVIISYWCCRGRNKSIYEGSERFSNIKSWQDHVAPPLPSSTVDSQQAFFPVRSPGPRSTMYGPESSVSQGRHTRVDEPPYSGTRTSYITYDRGTEFDDDAASHLEGATTILPSSSISQRGGTERPETTVLGSHQNWEAPVTMAGGLSAVPLPQRPGPESTSDLPQTASRAPAPSIAMGLSDYHPQDTRSQGHHSLSASDFDKTTFVTWSGQPNPHSNWI